MISALPHRPHVIALKQYKDQGLNDYGAIFLIFSGIGFSGWISIEGGANGLDEIRRLVEFLKEMRALYYG